MIEVTDEMLSTWHDAFNQAAEEAVKADTPLTHTGDIARAALAAVLVIAERQWQEQYGDACRAGWWRGQHELCPRCGVALEREVARDGRGVRHPRYCVTCSNGDGPGPGCRNCRQTGFDQTPWPNCRECAP